MDYAIVVGMDSLEVAVCVVMALVFVSFVLLYRIVRRWVDA